MPTVSVDDRGRIYLPKEMREGSGDRFRAVKLESGIKLIPISEDPVEGLREAMNGAKGVDIDSMGEEVNEMVKKEVEEDL